MSNLTVENVYTRHTAKELSRKHFWKLLGMTLLVFLIIYAATFATTALLNLVAGIPVTSAYTMSLGNIETPSSSTAPYAFTAAAPADLGGTYFVGYFLVLLINILISGGLTLGLTSAMLSICRNESVSVRHIFSRMKHCLKALGLSLWVGLKTILWALPVYALIFIAAFLIIGTAGTSAAQATESLTVLLALLPFFAMLLILVFVIPAVYRYMLSTYILADKPDTGVFACVRESKTMMKGHKWQAFKLVVPLFLVFLGMMLAIILLFVLSMAFAADASSILTIVLGIIFFLAIMLTSILFSMRINLAYCLFYLKRINTVQQPTE